MVNKHDLSNIELHNNYFSNSFNFSDNQKALFSASMS